MGRWIDRLRPLDVSPGKGEFAGGRLPRVAAGSVDSAALDEHGHEDDQPQEH